MVTEPAVIAGSDAGGEIVSCPPGRLKPIVQGAGQSEAFASRVAGAREPLPGGGLASRVGWAGEPPPESAFVVTKSEDVPPMPTFDVVELLLLFESVSVAVADALRTTVPLPLAGRVIVCVAVLLFDNVPIEQVIVVVPLQLPCVDDGRPLSVMFAGSAIVAVTFDAAAGPLLVTMVV